MRKSLAGRTPPVLPRDRPVRPRPPRRSRPRHRRQRSARLDHVGAVGEREGEAAIWSTRRLIACSLCSRSRAAKRSLTTAGARPSDGSSSSSNRGWPSARARARASAARRRRGAPRGCAGASAAAGSPRLHGRDVASRTKTTRATRTGTDLRAPELVELRVCDVDLRARTIYRRRRKGSNSSVHPMSGMRSRRFSG